MVRKLFFSEKYTKWKDGSWDLRVAPMGNIFRHIRGTWIYLSYNTSTLKIWPQVVKSLLKTWADRRQTTNHKRTVENYINWFQESHSASIGFI